MQKGCKTTQNKCKTTKIDRLQSSTKQPDRRINEKQQKTFQKYHKNT